MAALGELRVLTHPQITLANTAGHHIRRKQSFLSPQQNAALRWATSMVEDLSEKGFLTCSSTDQKVRMILRHYNFLTNPHTINLSSARSIAINLVKYCHWSREQVEVIAKIWGYRVCDNTGITVGFSIEECDPPQGQSGR